MRHDINKETLSTAIAELKTREAVAAHFGLTYSGLYPYLKKYHLQIAPPPALPMKGHNGEMKVRIWLGGRGFEAHLMPYTSAFDILCNGKRVEVKTAKFKSGRWFFNIHRHGKLDESNVDIYVLRLEGVPFSKAAIHLVMSAPLKRPSVTISLRSLLTRYAQYFNRFDLLR